uniref:DUF4200 domain-containing protein n=1 Tax=Heterorhabditis bacteriophora TaxID=37862 RepID=A0A1I7XHR7_HETBA
MGSLPSKRKEKKRSQKQVRIVLNKTSNNSDKHKAKVGPLITSNEDDTNKSTKSDEERRSNEVDDGNKQNDGATEKIELTEGVVQDYINLEKAINRLERKNVLKKYELNTIYADNLKNTLEQLEAVLKELKKQTEREKSDLHNIEQPSVKDFLKQKGEWDQRFTKEKSEYMDAVKRQEMIEMELEMAKINYEKAQKIAEIYKQQTDNQNALYDEQDKMLARIFGTEYVSEKESILEREEITVVLFLVDDVMDWQQRVSLAMFKWANGRVLLVHALTQITFGINRWNDIKGIDINNPRDRYFAAAEARNNMIAAAQNVQSCRMYLNKYFGQVEFPYATEEEIMLMEDTVTKAFRNVKEDSVVNNALEVFRNTQQKVSSLIQWFDKVINDTIRQDLDQANNSVIKKQKALRKERLSIMKKKTKKELGHNMEFEYDEIDEDELEKELKELEEEALRDRDKINSKNIQEILTMSQPEGSEAPLPLNKLAPTPSKDALFGMQKSDFV